MKVLKLLGLLLVCAGIGLIADIVDTLIGMDFKNINFGINVAHKVLWMVVGGIVIFLNKRLNDF